MSLIVKNIDTVNVDIGDLGITLTPGQEYDLTQDRPMDIAASTDLTDAITAGTVAILDPLDDTTQLSLSDAQVAVGAMNDSHFRIRGGALTQLDDIVFTNTQDRDQLYWDNAAQQWVNGDPQVVQLVYGNIQASLGTTVIPQDDTTPLVTEGTEIGVGSITPRHQDHLVKINFSFLAGTSDPNEVLTLAVFRDSTCIGVFAITPVTGTGASSGDSQLTGVLVDAPNTTNIVNYSGRVGVTDGTWRVNTPDNGADYGGSLVNGSYFTLMELSL